ncbi:hypothetical protein [Bacillus atrophaeus]|uniref:hypothetical protein n=1 Tax=Bacillus atrophaeus TaxID=1452 RepID=UPI002DBAC8EA|nr:hypothetical protein [Bacillus atrophaeus]MEC1900723.1 hypothetical protein [Bacillus atrophaeus]MEC2396558.1 hypothetical protein [Bacillus atrophaeus]MED4436213.1 hypothetical protein [Bacillus atrophaeus]MED4563819.1 hypothetical protein [Bacillus atrophaeus]MED4575140.1 hypothetical protein [Bacillus atrophaeus]
MKTHIRWASFCLLVFMVTAFWIYGQQDYKVEKIKDKNQVLTEKVKELSHAESVDGASENKAFFEAFFNYSDIDKRYETVKRHTTGKGLDYAFPSRSSEKHSVSVQSELRSLESYSKPIDDSNELFLNIVEVATTANSVTSHQVLIVQTTMKKEKNKWLVDDVQVKGNG